MRNSNNRSSEYTNSNNDRGYDNSTHRGNYGRNDRSGYRDDRYNDNRNYYDGGNGGYYDQRNDRDNRTSSDYFQGRNSVSENGGGRWAGLDSQSRGRRDYGSRRIAARENAMGYHGSLQCSRVVENTLFDRSEHVTEGINFDNYDSIPVEVSGDLVPEPIVEFSKENLPESLFLNIIRCQYKKPTPVQKYGLAIGNAGRDLMACAQTGSGKTAGFLFPIISRMLAEKPRSIDRSHTLNEMFYPTCLILSPTRELAVQIHDEAERFCYCTGIATSVVYGGTPMNETMKELRKGADMLVGTPGRVLDLLERGYISLTGIKLLVLDEADRMLDMGFEPQIRSIVEENRMPRDRQTMMFSATFPNEIQRLAGDFMNDYIFLAVGRVGSAASDIEQRVMYVEENEKESILLHELESVGEGRVLIFVETKRKADLLQKYLWDERFYVASIHGDRSQADREDALNAFKANRVQILVATDVAARGLDIPDVSLVINFDTPQNIEDYVHRIGRTGRAGNIGVAISFINENNRPITKDLYNLLDENNQKIPPFLEDMCMIRQRGPKGRNFGGRDIRHGAQRSTHYVRGNSGENRSEGRGEKPRGGAKRGSGRSGYQGRGGNVETNDSWN